MWHPIPDQQMVVQALRAGRRIPVAVRLPMDAMGTPQSVLQRLPARPPYWLLESGGRHAAASRYSYLGWEAQHVLEERWGDTAREPFLAKIQAVLQRYASEPVAGLPPFTGGAIGFFGYEARHMFEQLPQRVAPDIALPTAQWAFFDTLIAWDHAEQHAYIITNLAPVGDPVAVWRSGVERLERISVHLRTRCAGGAVRAPTIAMVPTIHGSADPDHFAWMVQRALAHIRAGDIYQANLSVRFAMDTVANPWQVYRRLQCINPAPYACFGQVGGVSIVSCSPELLIHLHGRTVTTRPIAGTRPRGGTPDEDFALSVELLLSDKERAEHLMLVDLERNDVGRVCAPHTVHVQQLMTLEEYSHVRHIVSQVGGQLAPACTWMDLVAATFPGGTITGCPKIRAMQMIDTLEPVARSLYTGSIGWISYTGDLALNIVIRTLLMTPQRAYISAGAGIVADSQPEREYAEVQAKAQALIEALHTTGAVEPVGLGHHTDA